MPEKKKKKIKKKKDDALATTGETALAQSGGEDWGEYADQGNENLGQDDLATPFLGLAQSKSPEIEDPEKKIPGLELGDIFNPITQEIYERPLTFVPVTFRTRWCLWADQKAGGGFKGDFGPNDKFVRDALQNHMGDSPSPILPDGSTLLETKELFAILNPFEKPEIVLISHAKTKIKVFKRLMTALNTPYMMRPASKRPPMFAKVCQMDTFHTKSAAGHIYYNYNYTPEMIEGRIRLLLPSHEIMSIAAELCKSVNDGTVKTQAPSADGPMDVEVMDPDDIPFD